MGGSADKISEPYCLRLPNRQQFLSATWSDDGKYLLYRIDDPNSESYYQMASKGGGYMIIPNWLMYMIQQPMTQND